MSSYRRLKRTELFFVRVWIEEQADTAAEADGKKAVCKGKVQRVVNGESRQFDNWQDLVDVLAAMLSLSTHDSSRMGHQDQTGSDPYNDIKNGENNEQE